MRRRYALLRKSALEDLNTRHPATVKLSNRGGPFLNPLDIPSRGPEGLQDKRLVHANQDSRSIIKVAGRRAREAARNSEYAKMIMTIPGFADFSAPVAALRIGDTDLPNSPEVLCPYARVMSPVRR